MRWNGLSGLNTDLVSSSDRPLYLGLFMSWDFYYAHWGGESTGAGTFQNQMLCSPQQCAGVCFGFFFWRIFSTFFLTSLLGHIRIGVWNFQEQQGVSQGSNSNGDKVFGWLFKLPTHIHINTASPHTHTYPQPHFSRLPFNCSEILLDWHFPHQERRVQPIEILTINYSASTSLSHSFSSNKVGLEIEGHSSTPNAVYFGLHLSIYSSIHLISSLPQVWMIFFFYIYVSMNMY